MNGWPTSHSHCHFHMPGFTQLTQDATIEPDVQKSMKQCLHLLSKLGSVWQEVLPCNVYHSSIGEVTLCPTFEYKHFTSGLLFPSLRNIVELCGGGGLEPSDESGGYTS